MVNQIKTWKKQDSMIMSCLREKELTRGDVHEAVMTRGRCYLGSAEENEDENANMAMDVPVEEDCEQTWQKLGTGD